MRKNFNINLDQEFYIVVLQHKSGPYIPETDIADATKEALLRDLIDGQYEDVLNVIYFNPVEGHSRDVSEDIAREWIERLAQDPDIDESGFEPEMRIPAFIKMHLPDYEAYAAEVMDDYRLNQQDADRLYGCPARI